MDMDMEGLRIWERTRKSRAFGVGVRDVAQGSTSDHTTSVRLHPTIRPYLAALCHFVGQRSKNNSQAPHLCIPTALLPFTCGKEPRYFYLARYSRKSSTVLQRPHANALSLPPKNPQDASEYGQHHLLSYPTLEKRFNISNAPSQLVTGIALTSFLAALSLFLSFSLHVDA
jgi:hypothetical protein